MNLESLKLGFQNYLNELGEISGKNYISDGSDISIFMYSNEFKNYISDELNVSPSILSKSINDILKMEIVNGQLVDPSEEESEEVEDSDKTNSEIDLETAEALPDEQEGEMLLQTPSDGEENPFGLVSDSPINGILNELLQTDEFKSVIDTDKSGELDQNEIEDFLNTIKDFDNNGDDISLDDIMAAIDSIKEGTFGVETEAEETEVEEQEDAEVVSDTPDAGDATKVNNSNGTNSTGRASGARGSSGGNYSAPVKEKTLENMNKEELNAELTKAQDELSAKQNTLQQASDGSLPELKSLKETEDKAYEAYQDQLKLVDETMAKQLDSLKKDIDEKEQSINKKEVEISNKEVDVSNCENSYNNAVETTKSLKAQMDVLNGTDTSELDDSQKADLNSKKEGLKAQIEKAEQAEQDTKDAWDKAKDELSKLKEEKEKLTSGEGGLNELKEKMTTLEGEISKKYPEVQEYMDAYNTAKKDYTDAQQNAIKTAQQDITTAQNRVNEVQTAISNYDTKQTVKEYSMISDLEEAIEWARQYDNFNQSQMREIFAKFGYQFDTNAWCADFVRMVLFEAVGEENLPDWYQSVQNKAYCPSIQAAGEGHQISAEEAQPGDIVLFDWDGDGNADHVGLFVDNGDGSTTITTIEGNTSGDGGSSCVDEKPRNRGKVLGIYSMHD